ncbi:hypothetical protein FJ980_25185 [Mesorhizobium sp. B1-1-5]|nr:hypothetical protein FJ980_25185 [Mesorhizobium sp. B1-1-5]
MTIAMAFRQSPRMPPTQTEPTGQNPCAVPLGCVEIQVRPSRERWFPRTGAERTKVREHRKLRKSSFAGRHHLNINTA